MWRVVGQPSAVPAQHVETGWTVPGSCQGFGEQQTSLVTRKLKEHLSLVVKVQGVVQVHRTERNPGTLVQQKEQT